MKNRLSLSTISFIVCSFLHSCKGYDYRGWNNYPKYNSYLIVKLNEDFNNVLNCSVNGYSWSIKNEKAFNNIRFLEKIQQNQNCSEIWNFKAFKIGKDSIVFEYRKGADVVVRNTIIVEIE